MEVKLMSESLNIQLSDDAYAALCREANATGTTPSQLATRSLEEQYAVSPRNDEESNAARERFEHHFGSLDLGYATGADNRSIDADLAEEYAANQEKS
jgi:hypothetical protein